MIILCTIIYLLLSLIIYKNVSLTNPHKDIDSGGYEKYAVQFYNTNSFSNFTPHKTAAAQQPLGYPLFLGTIYKLFGHNNSYIIWIQIFLTLLSNFFIYLIASRFFNKTIGLIAFAIASINLGYLVFAQFILAESLQLFFLTVFFEELARFLITRKYIAITISGLSLGISTLIKPAALYYILFVILILIFFFNTNIYQKFKTIIILTICFSIPVISYMGYNKSQYGSFRFTSCDTFNLYIWFWAKVKTSQRNINNQQQFALEQQKHTSLISGSYLEEKSWKNLKTAFWNDVKANPFLFAYTWIKEMIKTYLGLYISNLKVLLNSNIRGKPLSYFHNKGSIFQKIHKYISNETKSNTIKFIGYLELIWSLLRYLFCLIGLFYLLIKK